MSQIKHKLVYSQWLAIELKIRGHKIVDTMPNPNCPELTTWIFEVDETFYEDFDELRRKE